MPCAVREVEDDKGWTFGTIGLGRNPSGDGKDAIIVNGKQRYEIHNPSSLYREVY